MTLAAKFILDQRRTIQFFHGRFAGAGSSITFMRTGQMRRQTTQY
jgi:hypothetical protein